jgi:hypothetical protein
MDAAATDKRAFRATWKLPAASAQATIIAAADNEATIFFNGKKIAETSDWRQPATAIVTVETKQGDNRILVVASNGKAGGPAGLRVEFRGRLVDGSDVALGTDGAWEWTATLPDAKGQYAKDKQPTDWQPAVVAADPGIWAAGEPAFVQAVATNTVTGSLPMVRAVVVKGTPLMAALGRPNRDQVVTSRPADLTTLEAIQLANEQSLADTLSRGGRDVLQAHGPEADPLVKWMFDAALARPATPAEAAAARELLGDKPTSDSVADCLWAIVMLPEFQLVR